MGSIEREEGSSASGMGSMGVKVGSFIVGDSVLSMRSVASSSLSGGGVFRAASPLIPVRIAPRENYTPGGWGWMVKLFDISEKFL